MKRLGTLALALAVMTCVSAAHAQSLQKLCVDSANPSGVNSCIPISPIFGLPVTIVGGTAGSGGSSGSASAVSAYGPDNVANAPTKPPIYNGFKDTSGLVAGVSPATQLPAHDYDLRATSQTLPSASGSFIDIPVDGKSIVGLRFSGLAASGATITYLSSNDATQTPASPISSLNAATGVTSPTRTTDGETRIPVSGRTTLRLAVTTGGTGSITVSYNVSRAGTIVDLGSPLPPGNNQIGTIGNTDFPDAKSGTALGAPGDAAPLPGASGSIIGQLKALISQNASYTSAGTATASGTLPSPATMPNGGAPRGFAYSCDGTTPVASKTTVTFSGGGTTPLSVGANSTAREGLSVTSATAVTGCTFQALY